MLDNELKPVRCGCGGEAMIDAYLGDLHRSNLYYIYCAKCDIRTSNYLSEAEVIEAWNRAMGALLPEGDPQKNDGCECSNTTERTANVNVHYRDESVVFGFCECGQAVNTYSTYCPHCGARLEWK